MKLTTYFARVQKWLHRVTRDPKAVRPVLAGSVIVEPNRAGTLSWVAMLGEETVKSMTGYSTEAAARDAGVRWVESLGHVVRSGGRSFAVGSG